MTNTVCQKDPCVSFCHNIQDPGGYLLLASDRDPGYVEYLGPVDLRTRCYHAIFNFKGAGKSSHHHSLALCRYHLSLATTMLEGQYSTITIPLPLQDAAFSALGTQIHRMRRACSASDELICDTGDEYPNFQWALPQGQCHENFFLDGKDFPRYHLWHVALVRLSFGPSSGDVGSGDSHVRSSVNGHEACFVTNPVLCEQARVCPFHNDSMS
jgi:hypothetical protein